MAAPLSQRKLAEYVAMQLHDHADPALLARQVTAYLIDHKQTQRLELLIRDIEQALARNYGVVPVRVTSARPLDAQTRQQLAAFVREAEQARDVVVTQETVDESLIGGVIVETPTSILDSSVKSSLRQLRATTKV